MALLQPVMPLNWLASVLALAMTALACDDSEPAAPPRAFANGARGDSSAAAGDAGPENGEDDADVSPNAPPSAARADGGPLFPADWCARAGAYEGAPTAMALLVTETYVNATFMDCETAGLIAAIDIDRAMDWFSYIRSYTLAMAGCPPTFGVVEDGIEAFGPANLAAIGIDRPRLGADDVENLIDKYLVAFGDALDLNDDERGAVREFLQDRAREQIEPGASLVFSVCPSPADAGPSDASL